MLPSRGTGMALCIPCILTSFHGALKGVLGNPDRTLCMASMQGVEEEGEGEGQAITSRWTNA